MAIIIPVNSKSRATGGFIGQHKATGAKGGGKNLLIFVKYRIKAGFSV